MASRKKAKIPRFKLVGEGEHQEVVLFTEDEGATHRVVPLSLEKVAIIRVEDLWFDAENDDLPQLGL
jgi:hypothetical protein